MKNLNKDGFTFTRKELDDKYNTYQIDLAQINIAIEVMDECGDNVAHFGANGYFLFSKFKAELAILH
jgi:hypothetical protein